MMRFIFLRITLLSGCRRARRSVTAATFEASRKTLALRFRWATTMVTCAPFESWPCHYSRRLCDGNRPHLDGPHVDRPLPTCRMFQLDDEVILLGRAVALVSLRKNSERLQARFLMKSPAEWGAACHDSFCRFVAPFSSDK